METPHIPPPFSYVPDMQAFRAAIIAESLGQPAPTPTATDKPKPGLCFIDEEGFICEITAIEMEPLAYRSVRILERK